MDRVAVLVDDLADAERSIGALLGRATPPSLCIVVMCAPKLTHRIGPWAAHRSRERLRERWAAGLRERLEPVFQGAPSTHVVWVLARAPLPEVTHGLRQTHGEGLAVLDARHPRADPATAAGGHVAGRRLRGICALLAGMSMLQAAVD
jgi:hypothetical protein